MPHRVEGRSQGYLALADAKPDSQRPQIILILTSRPDLSSRAYCLYPALPTYPISIRSDHLVI